MENCIDVVPYNSSVLVTIREPGSQGLIRKIECTPEQARELALQILEALEK